MQFAKATRVSLVIFAESLAAFVLALKNWYHGRVLSEVPMALVIWVLAAFGFMKMHEGTAVRAHEALNQKRKEREAAHEKYLSLPA